MPPPGSCSQIRPASRSGWHCNHNDLNKSAAIPGFLLPWCSLLQTYDAEDGDRSDSLPYSSVSAEKANGSRWHLWAPGSGISGIMHRLPYQSEKSLHIPLKVPPALAPSAPPGSENSLNGWWRCNPTKIPHPILPGWSPHSFLTRHPTGYQEAVGSSREIWSKNWK